MHCMGLVGIAPQQGPRLMAVDNHRGKDLVGVGLMLNENHSNTKPKFLSGADSPTTGTVHALCDGVVGFVKPGCSAYVNTLPVSPAYPTSVVQVDGSPSLSQTMPVARPLALTGAVASVSLAVSRTFNEQHVCHGRGHRLSVGRRDTDPDKV